VFAVYSAEIGALTPTISEALQDAETEYSAEWVVAAIEESARQNARSWKYAEAILRRWRVEGFQSRQKKRQAGGKAPPKQRLGVNPQTRDAEPLGFQGIRDYLEMTDVESGTATSPAS
jgi:DnaD/phage-associated family protein